MCLNWACDAGEDLQQVMATVRRGKEGEVMVNLRERDDEEVLDFVDEEDLESAVAGCLMGMRR